MDSLDDFKPFPFTSGKWTRQVYCKGGGPAVVVIHEMPGITPSVASFARMVVDAGFTVYMPSLFGTPGAEPTKLVFAKEYVRLCVNREFRLLQENQSSPVTDWLRALAKLAWEQAGGRGVGAVGMCITGNFALTMALDPHLLAPVLAQPSLPWPPIGDKADALHASPETLDTIRRRHRDEGLTVLGLRFRRDKICPHARFARLIEELGPAFEGHELDNGGAGEAARPHSVLTEDLIDKEGEPTRKALRRVLAFLSERLH